MNSMDIYNRMPIAIQNLLTTIKGYSYKKKRYGKVYKNALEEYLHRDYTDREALIDYQWERIDELVHFAVNNSPFYKDFYKDINIDKIIEKRDISAFPLLDKEVVRNKIETMYALPEPAGQFSNTSGTTGKSMRFLCATDDIQRRMAYLDYFKITHGFVPMKMRRASFSSAKIVPPHQKAHVYWRTNLAINQRIYSGKHCKGDLVKYFIQDLNKYKPQSLDGYPSAMYEIARYINDNNIMLDFKPIAIFPTAETLLPHYRKEIEKAFKCPVRDQYASSEGAPFIVECKCGKLHVALDTGLIEFMDDGRMVVTCFETHGTPLIRYDIKDVAVLAQDQSCSCGWNTPIVDHIEGRTVDYVLSPRYGKITSVYLSLVSEDFHNCMKAMQFVQNDINSIDVYLETDDRYQKYMDQIIADKLHYYMGDEVTVRIHRVREIEKDSSGKFRFVVNNALSK